MDPSTNFFHVISPYLPDRVLQGLRNNPVDEIALDNLVRLIGGAEPSPNSTPDVIGQWAAKRTSVSTLLSSITRSNLNDNKRPPENMDTTPASKRPRLSPSETADLAPDNLTTGRVVFALSPISATAPVRKKIDITIREDCLSFTNPSSKAEEVPSIALSTFRRAFLLPTRGKTKPHWTVVILSSDSQPTVRGKSAKSLNEENPQVIFGLDAKLTNPLKTATYDAEGKPTVTTHAKKADALPILREFLDHLRIPLFEPTPSIFKSAAPSLGKSAVRDGVPGIEAYRSAKAGSLWFMPEGILWGESKPCEFWAVEDLIGKTEGLRILGGTGKTCSVLLTRMPADPSPNEKKQHETHSDDEAEEDYGEETEFTAVDSKEKTVIENWVQQYRHLFGTAGGRVPDEGSDKKRFVSNGPLTIHQIGDESDFSDGSFSVSSTSSGSSDSSPESNGEEGGDDENASGGGSDSGCAEEGENEGGSNEEEEELDPADHPLLQAGALPRMSKNVMDLAVGMVMSDMMGDDSDEEQVDELME
jgi:hypothetical protein